MNLSETIIRNQATTGGLDKYMKIGRTHLQVIAFASMFIDHFSAAFLIPAMWESGMAEGLDLIEFIMRGILGRLAFPLFIFMLVEAIYHSRNIPKYLIRILILGIVSFIPHMLCFSGEIWSSKEDINVLFTLFAAGLSLYIIKKETNLAVKILSVVLACGFTYAVASEYAIVGVLMAVIFYQFRYQIKKLLIFGGLSIILGGFLVGFLYFLRHGISFDTTMVIGSWENEMSALLSLGLIYLYDENKNKGLPKAVTYGFYPVHLLLIYLLEIIIL